ncbi:MAG: hypothetical protein HY673_13925 [Chloroflexi bacterium]|nr:hypothetical protein [Chloroflexota bacterium]
MKYRELVKAVNSILAGYSVQLTLRQVYYRLVVAGLIANTRSDYNQLSSQTVKARESGDVDDRRFTDRSRRIDDVSFDSPGSFLEVCQNTLKGRYVRRFWDSQSVYCEVWVEKDALSQVLAEAVYPFNTIVAPSRGYSSYSFLREAASRINQHCGDGKRAVILHFADHDPSGIDMSRDLQDRLAKYCGRREVEVRRIALTHDQVREYKLIPNPVKQADRRSTEYVSQYGDECWELDAIEPDELIMLCQAAVQGLIENGGTWQAIKKQDEAEREALIKQLKGIVA